MRSLREAWGEGLADLADEDSRVVVLDADLANSTRADIFHRRHPARFLQMGIAEQNMVGVAAGMATLGLRPWLSSFAAFLVERDLDQVKLSVVQTHLPVVLAGGYAGLLNGRTGKTHQALYDLGVMRLLPGMTVVAPCDAVELLAAMRTIATLDGPAYVRLTRDPSPIVSPDGLGFELGLPRILRAGADPFVIVSTGVQSVRALAASEVLAGQGFDVRLVHLPTLAPIDADAVLDSLAGARLVVTVEDHARVGGLGSLIAELVTERTPILVRRFGLDGFAESGSNDDLLMRYGLAPAVLAPRLRSVIEGVTLDD